MLSAENFSRKQNLQDYVILRDSYVNKGILIIMRQTDVIMSNYMYVKLNNIRHVEKPLKSKKLIAENTGYTNSFSNCPYTWLT